MKEFAHLEKRSFDLTLSSLVAITKHVYSNILKITPPKNWNFSNKNFDIFHISAQKT